MRFFSLIFTIYLAMLGLTYGTYASLCSVQAEFFRLLFCFLLAAPGLHCCLWAFSSCSEQGLLFIAVCRFIIVVASLVV